MTREDLTKTRIQRSLCKEIFDVEFLRILHRLFLDGVRLNPDVINEIGWKTIWADNSGEMDAELDAVVQWLQANEIDVMYASSMEEIERTQADGTLVVRLENPNAEDLQDLQLGLWMFVSDDSEDDFTLGWPSWRDGLYFSNPLKFAILRIADGYGNTTVAGPPSLIEAIRASATHGLYVWEDGFPPKNPHLYPS